MVGKGKRKSASSEESLGPASKKTKGKARDSGVDQTIKSIRRSSSNVAREEYELPGTVFQELAGMSLTPDVIAKLLQLTVDTEIQKSKLDESPKKDGLQWDQIPVHSLVRGIIRIFLQQEKYDTADWLSCKAKKGVFFKVLQDLFISENLEPSYQSFKTDTAFSQFVVGPFVERVKRTKNTFTGDLISFLACKIYGKTETKYRYV